MSLLGNAGEKSVPEAAADSVANDKPKVGPVLVEASTFKEKKKAAAARFKERQLAKRDDTYKNALALKDALTKEGVFEKLSTEVRTFVANLAKDPAERRVATGFGGPSVFSTIFGENPKLGTSVTLQAIFDKTAKGKSTMDVWLKRWDEKGIKVEFKANKEKFTESTYTLRALPV
jgi:basic membrane lipoprotein Med (substrate-binding protein (PBP1-ABC) superfamily)